MHRPLLLVALVLPTLACPAEEDDDGGDTSGTPTTTASTTQSTTTTATTTTATTTGTTTDASSEGGSTEEGASESSEASGTVGDESSTAGADLCAPDGADDACTTCAKTMCCEAYASCYGDPDCVCAVDCIIATGDYATCLGEMCNMPDPAPAMDIGICCGMTCAADCGFG